MASLSDPIPASRSPLTISLALLLARSLAAIAAALTTFLLARLIPSADLGSVMAMVSAAMIGSLVLSLNIETGAMRFLTEARAANAPDRIHGFIHFSRRVIRVLALPVMAGTALFLILTGAPFSAPLLVGLLMIPAFAWSRATARHAGALHQVLRGGLPQLTIRPLTVLVGIALAAAFGWPLTPLTVLLLFLAGAVLTIALQTRLLAPVLAPILATPPDDTEAADWAATGVRLAPSLLFQDLLRDLVLVLSALGLGASDTGILAICLTIVLLPNLALVGIEMGYGPQISAACVARNRPELAALLRQAAGLRLAATLPATVLIAGFAEPILGFFGPDYVAGATPLRLLCLLPLTRAAFGNPFLILSVAGEAAAIFRITGLGLIAMLAVIPAAALFGLPGAAIAACAGFALVQVWLYASCRASAGADTSALSLIASRAP